MAGMRYESDIIALKMKVFISFDFNQFLSIQAAVIPSNPIESMIFFVLDFVPILYLEFLSILVTFYFAWKLKNFVGIPTIKWV